MAFSYQDRKDEKVLHVEILAQATNRLTDVGAGPTWDHIRYVQHVCKTGDHPKLCSLNNIRYAAQRATSAKVLEATSAECYMNQVEKKRPFTASKAVAAAAPGATEKSRMKQAKAKLEESDEIVVSFSSAAREKLVSSSLVPFTWFHTKQGKLLHLVRPDGMFGTCWHTRACIPLGTGTFCGVKEVIESGRQLCPACWKKAPSDTKTMAKENLSVAAIPHIESRDSDGIGPK